MDQFPVDQFQGGAGTSVNMNANEVIANLALEILGEEKGRYDIINPNDHVNRSQSTNDAYPTAFRIALWRKVNRLRKAIDELADSFDEKGAEFRHILTMGRTQLQDAVPMSLGSEFSAFAHTLREEDERLVNNAELLLETNLGATAIGTGLNTPDGYQQVVVRHLRRITGARVVGSPNLLEATSDTGAYVSMHATIKRSAVKLSKVCNDLRLLASGLAPASTRSTCRRWLLARRSCPPRSTPSSRRLSTRCASRLSATTRPSPWRAEAGQLQLNVMEPVDRSGAHRVHQPPRERLRYAARALHHRASLPTRRCAAATWRTRSVSSRTSTT